MDRRTAIKWMLTAAAAAAVLERDAVGADPAMPAAKGYGTDPDLLKDYKPGAAWPLTFNETERATAAALCDVIIPADAKSPSAASLGVHDFIDEWISAPYAEQAADRKPILEGLAWLNTESQRRFQNDFVSLIASQQNALCSDLAYAPIAKPEFMTAAQFFKKFRDLTAGGFYTTPVGMKDLGYIGNVPRASFAGPTSEVLKKLGLV
ncbi:MAG: gluconate 2-dehydrogenase subunit 3 family protein [Undibacterium sp.]|nr:gluconate 2-dehydrogenase subunit 3 family protein [Opitutaceae bacterium]